MPTARTPQPARFAVLLAGNVRRLLDPADVYFAEAADGDTRIRLHGKQPLVDIRKLDKVAAVLERHGFLRIHRSFVVNPARILEIRPRGRDYEVKLEPPVNAVLPVSRDATDDLLARFK